MQFENRKSIAIERLLDFLQCFARPRGLDDDAQATILQAIADAFARLLPLTDTAAYEKNIAKTFTTIRDQHKSHTWPTQSDFVTAMPKPQSTPPRIETFNQDRLATLAQRVQRKEAIPETWVWNYKATLHSSSEAIARDTLEGYRYSSVKHYKETYGCHAFGVMQRRFGDVVGVYFETIDDKIKQI